MVVLERVSKSFNIDSKVVDELSLHVSKGEILVLLGSSGSGKSTTLKMINRLIEPDSGSIFFNGKNIRDLDPINLRRAIGYVIQEVGLFPHMSVRENISIVPRLLSWSQDKITNKCEELLELIHLPFKTYKDKFPGELSGGQQQRIGVARALAANPDCLLMDEPFGALDAITRDSLQQELLNLQRSLEKTLIFVTHDIFEALTLADRIAILHKGQLEQIGTKHEIIEKPSTEFVKNLFAKPAKQLALYKGIL